MGKNIIGIDISDFSIEAVALEKDRHSFKLESYARFRLSPEIVEDGQILDKEKLKSAILKLFKSAKPVVFDKSRKVFLSIPESQTFSKIFSVPKNIKNKELETVVFNKAEELIPESIDKLTAIIKVLAETDKDKQVFYTAVSTEILQSFVSVFNELDIEVVGITTEANSSFAGIKESKDKKNTLVLDLGARTTIASIFTKHGLYSNINIAIGGDNITKAIAKKLKITYKQAEDKKVKIGLTADEYGEIMLIAQGQLQPLVDELKVFIEYWQKSSGNTIEQVVLIGGLSQMKDIDKYFGEDLNIATQIGQPFIDTDSLWKGLNSSKYINALGLARLAQQGTDINFFDKMPKAKKQKNTNNNINNNNNNQYIENQNNIKTKWLASFKNKYVLFGLGIIFLAAALFLFKNKIPILKDWVALPTWEEKIYVAIDNPNGISNFIPGEYYDLLLYKTYTTSTDETLPDDYVENFSNNLIALEKEANIKVLPKVAESYTPEGYYVIPQIISYESTDIVPLEENYKVGDVLEADINYRFMMFSYQSLKDWLINKDPKVADKLGSFDFEIINYTLDSEGANFNILVLINKKSD
ncbi:MAG: pilus assembly protein PilM [Patescibacteria group bacterium]|jgi:type IV pilus assembly protein PilM